MPIISNNYQKSAGLAAELNAISKAHGSHNPFLGCKHISAFFDAWMNPMHRITVEDAVTTFPPASRILDIGVGYGHTSLYFASKGHTVFPVEPSHDYCLAIDALAAKFGYSLTIYESAMEALSTNERFDICVFNASLHHCDDPLLALRKCYDLLRPGGRVYLINEQVLKFFNSKKWFERMMVVNPQKIGHYGGNEHVYRFQEYRDMIKNAGFRMVEEKLPAYYLSPRTGLSHLITVRNEHGFAYSDGRVLSRYLWYLVLKKALSFKLCLSIAKRLSLITCTFIAEKP